MTLPPRLGWKDIVTLYPGITKASAQALLRKLGGVKVGGQRYVTLADVLMWEARQRGKTVSILETGNAFNDSIVRLASQALDCAQAQGLIEIKTRTAA